MNLLHTIGLMTRAEHERIVQAEILQSIKAANRASDEKGFRFKAEKRADELEAKFKRAATDLAKQAEEIAQMKVDMSRAAEAADNYLNWIAGLEAEVQALRPDAEAMRKKRAADRKRMAGKRNG